MYSMCVHLMDGQDSPANAWKRPSFISCFVASPPPPPWPPTTQRGVHVAKIDPTSPPTEAASIIIINAGA